MHKAVLWELIARWSVLSLFCLIPFFAFPVAWVTIAQSKMALIALVSVVGTVAIVFSVAYRGSIKISKSPILCAAALLPIAYLVSALASHGGRDSFLGGLGEQDTVAAITLVFALLFISQHALSERTRIVPSALRALIAGAAVLIVVQTLHLFVPAFDLHGAIAGTAGNLVGSWQDLGIFLGLVLFLSLALLGDISFTKLLWRVLAAFSALGSFFLLLVADIPDVWIGLGLVALLYVLVLWRTDYRSLRRIPSAEVFLWVAVVLAAFLLAWQGSVIQRVLPAPLRVMQLEVRPSWKGTLAIGSQVFSQPSDIVFGSGPNTFSIEWGLYKPLSVNTTQFWNADFPAGVGLVPTSLVTEGALGVLAWIAVFLALLWSGVRVLRTRVPEARDSLRLIVFLSALYLAAFNIFYVPAVALTALLFLFLGAVVALEVFLHAGAPSAARDWTVPISRKTWSTAVRTAVLLALALCILVAAVYSLLALASDAYVNRAMSAYNTDNDLLGALGDVNSAISIAGDNDRAQRAAVELGLIQLEQLAAQNDTTAAGKARLQAAVAATISHALTAVSVGDRNYQNWLDLATVYGQLEGAGVQDADAYARDAYAHAIAVYPTDPQPLLGLAQIDLAQGSTTEAREELSQALVLKPDIASAYYGLSQIDARAGDLAEAETEATRATQLAPQDPSGWYNLGTVYYALGDYANAVTVLRRAAGLENDYGNALFLLGLSLDKLGQTQDALAALQQVALLDPTDPTPKQAIENIEAGKDALQASTSTTPTI